MFGFGVWGGLFKRSELLYRMVKRLPGSSIRVHKHFGFEAVGTDDHACIEKTLLCQKPLTPAVCLEGPNPVTKVRIRRKIGV